MIKNIGFCLVASLFAVSMAQAQVQAAASPGAPSVASPASSANPAAPASAVSAGNTPATGSSAAPVGSATATGSSAAKANASSSNSAKASVVRRVPQSDLAEIGDWPMRDSYIQAIQTKLAESEKIHGEKTGNVETPIIEAGGALDKLQRLVGLYKTNPRRFGAGDAFVVVRIIADISVLDPGALAYLSESDRRAGKSAPFMQVLAPLAKAQIWNELFKNCGDSGYAEGGDVPDYSESARGRILTSEQWSARTHFNDGVRQLDVCEFQKMLSGLSEN